jgi:glycosyltransferase involved in cell wall biosynthesis
MYMRIVQVITRSDTVGGASVHVRDLAKAFLEQGHEVTVLVGGEGPYTALLHEEDIPSYSLRHLHRAINPLVDVRAVYELCHILRKLNPDVVATHTAKAGIVGRTACAVLNVPVTFTSHGWSVTDRISSAAGLVFRKIERCSAKFTSRIICVCEYEREVAIRNQIARPEDLAVVYNGIPDVPKSLRLAEVPRQPPCLTMVARMEAPKDHATLLHALVPLKSLAWTVQLIGDGPLLPRIQAETSQLGLQDKVKFLGNCAWDVKPALRTSQAFVLCSRSEALPLSILEAMRAGLPIVASSVGGVPEAVAHGVNGLLVPAKNPIALSGALSQIITDPALRISMGQASRELFTQKFGLSKMVTETLTIYRKVAHEPGVIPLHPTGIRHAAGD